MKNYLVFLFLFLFAFPMVCLSQDRTEEETDKIQTLTEAESLDNFKLNQAVKMYPNPVQQYLTIQSELPITRVQVFSLLGQLIKDVPSNFSLIYLGELNSGIYMIKIYSNEYHITKKLVKR